MRTLLNVIMPVEQTNKAIQKGKLQETIGALSQALHPEASYFHVENGKRTGLFVFDMKESFQLPSILEPFFNALNADITVAPVMNQEDLKKGLDSIKSHNLRYASL